MRITFNIFFLGLCIFSANAQNHFNQNAIELNNLGSEKIKVQQYIDAIIFFDRAIELDSTYYIAYNNKITALVGLKKIAEAINVNKLSIKQKPDLAEGHFFLGVLYDYIGDSTSARNSYNNSIYYYKERISNNINIESNEINLAMAYKFIGESEKSAKLFEKYLSDDKNNFTARILYDSSKQDFINSIFNNK